MAEPDRLAAALRYQQELEEAQRPATMNPNMAAQGRRMNLPERQVPGPVSAFGTQAMSLNPQPDQGYGTMAAEMALGFVPGIGQAMAARDIERARRDNDPIGMGMAATSFVPFGKLIGALRGGKQMGPVSELDVYHGSPHRFPPTAKNPLGEFDAAKIGTGEGAQAYGRGLYFAENPSVATQYRDALSAGELRRGDGTPYDPKNIKHFAAATMLDYKTPADAIKDINNQIKELGQINASWRTQAIADKKALISEIQKGGLPKLEEISHGSLYKVDLPDEQIAKMLDWDKPLREQPEILKVLKGEYRADYLSMFKDKPGSDFYKAISGNAGVEDLRASGSSELQKLGIPGIRYLDQGSRVGGAGTSNFVVFPGSEGQLNILGRE